LYAARSRTIPYNLTSRRLLTETASGAPACDCKKEKLAMSVEMQLPLNVSITEESRQIGSRWGHFLALGFMLVVLGTLAIFYSLQAAVLAMETLGIILVTGGVVQVFTSFWSGGWRGFFVQVILGILYAVAGTMMIRNPLPTASAVTLLLALAYIAGGLIRLAFAATHHVVGGGWILLNGVITFALGLMIWSQWPWDSLWVVGLFLGIDLVFVGWSWVMLGAAVRPRSGQAV
jgi:uncharacterized membrane protein HdeD (DUF308 family)